MGNLSGSALQVRVLWGNQHIWPAGSSYSGPCNAHALWLVLEGEARVSSGDECWHVRQGDALLWPRDKQRRIDTAHGASWLSLGLNVITPGQADFMSLLSLPATKALDATNHKFLQAWLRGIIDIRDTLTHEIHDKQELACHFEQFNKRVALPSYDRWLNQIVAERPSHFDVIEEGLGQAIVGMCWKLWGRSELEFALHHQLPPWLQTSLEKIRERPGISVQELSDLTGFSSAQYRRLFHQEMGLSPRDYLQRQRLDFARHLLEDTELPISIVAAKTGFASVPHFVSLWKKTNGLSPLKFRLSRKFAQI